MVIPSELVDLLRRAQFDPSATRTYEYMSGGFFWSDEFPDGYGDTAFRLNDFSHRQLIANRASIILGMPPRFPEMWDDFQKQAPNWPGFRNERCSVALAGELIASRRKRDAELDELDRQIMSAAKEPNS